MYLTPNGASLHLRMSALSAPPPLTVGGGGLVIFGQVQITWLAQMGGGGSPPHFATNFPMVGGGGGRKLYFWAGIVRCGCFSN